MRIGKPLLLITTPLGVIGGIHEAFRLTGGLAFLMIALVAFIGVAMAGVVATVRREQRELKSAASAQGSKGEAV